MVCLVGGRTSDPERPGDLIHAQELTSRRKVLIGGVSLATAAWSGPAITRVPGGRALATPACAPPEPGQAEVVFSTAGPATFTVPATVTSISVDVWGSGGNGADGTASTGSAGGGGGGLSRATLTVTECTEFEVTVGSAGGEDEGGRSTFFATPEISASGGENATGNTPGGGGVGSLADGQPGTARSGNSVNGGGGGAAGSSGDSVGGTGGAGGGNNGNGLSGNPPGGGGGGGGRNGDGGGGTDGRIRVSW